MGNISEELPPRNGNHHKSDVVSDGKRKSICIIPLGDQQKAVLRQQLMVLLINLGMLVSGISLALPAVTLNQLTDPDEKFHLDKSQASWFASASAIAAPIGSFSGAFIVDKIGRKKSVLLVNILATISWALMSTALYESSTLNFVQLMLSRIVSGIGVGMGGSPACVYGAEVCLPKIRARLTMVTSMMIAGGVLLAYIVGYFLRSDWRLIGVAFLALQTLCLILLIPVKETPSWLLSRGHIDEAKASLSYFRGLDGGDIHEEVEAEFATLQQHVQRKAGEQKTPLLKSMNLPEVYKPLLISIGFFGCAQFSGTFVVVVYAVQIITKAGVNTDPFLCAIFVGIARFIMTSFVMTWELEKWGRRQVSIFSAFSSAVCLFLLAASSWFTWLQSPILSAVVIVGFVVASSGMWSVPFLILPEIVPQKVRGAICGASIGCAYVISFFTIKVFPAICDLIGNGNVFALYGTVATLTMFFIYNFIPETKGKTLVEIEEYFSGSKKSTDEKNVVRVKCNEVIVKRKF